MEFVIDSEEKEVKIGKAVYYIAVILIKGFFFFVGAWLFRILYHECLHEPNCNIIVVSYLSLISLACFDTVGLPVSRLINVDLLKP